MNVQELLTYVEELAFKTSMFGYDKDEVDIQLDKICDEMEAIVKEKDKEIARLKNGGVIIDPAVEEDSSEESEKETASEEPIDEDADVETLRMQLASMKAKLAEAEKRAAEAEQLAAEAEERVVEAEKKAAAAEGKAAVAETKAAASAERKPVTKDEAYEQYLRNADLLCKQLSELQNKQDSIVESAKAEAEKILAKANAESLEIRGEVLKKMAEEQKQCDALVEQKGKLTESLKQITDEVNQLLKKVQAE